MKTTTIKKLFTVTFYALPFLAFVANFTEPRTEASLPPITQELRMPLKVTLYSSHRGRLSSLSHVPGNPGKPRRSGPTPQEVKAYVETAAMQHGVDPDLALWIVRHESQFNPRAKGDKEASRGLWQISKIYHPEVSDAVAFNIAGSTHWSLERIRAGKVNEWSTYRFCRTLYVDCPY